MEAIHQRAYESGRPHAGIRNVPQKHFVRVLEEIGLATWRGAGRTATISEIQNQCELAGLSRVLETFREGAAAGVAQLLTAFYFRQEGHGRTGEPSFEFTHKSFGEYLTARRFVRALERIQSERDRREESSDAGWNDTDCLKYWADLFRGAPRLTGDVYRFLFNDLRLRKREEADKWQNTLCSLIGTVLHCGMPIDQIAPKLNYQDESNTAITAEEALLVMLYVCSARSGKLSKIDWPNSTAAGAWINRLQGQRSGPENVLAMECLGFLSVRNSALAMKDLYQSNLIKSDLTTCQLHYANLGLANLRSAILRGSNLIGATCFSINLQDADLSESDLHESNLRKTKLQNANLQNAILWGANPCWSRSPECESAGN